MNKTVSLLAFAIQDESMTRLQAQRIARTILRALAHGDRVGRGLVVERQASPTCDPDNQAVEMQAEFDAE